jgi:hypothetical protein
MSRTTIFTVARLPGLPPLIQFLDKLQRLCKLFNGTRHLGAQTLGHRYCATSVDGRIAHCQEELARVMCHLRFQR